MSAGIQTAKGENKWDAYPSNVRQMLIKRSAPQPAIKITPAGGTVSKYKKWRVRKRGRWTG